MVNLVAHDGRAVHPHRHSAGAPDPHLGRPSVRHLHRGNGVGKYPLLHFDGGIEIDPAVLISRLNGLPACGVGRTSFFRFWKIGFCKPDALGIVKGLADPPVSYETKHSSHIHSLAVLRKPLNDWLDLIHVTRGGEAPSVGIPLRRLIGLGYRHQQFFHRRSAQIKRGIVEHGVEQGGGPSPVPSLDPTECQATRSWRVRGIAHEHRKRIHWRGIAQSINGSIQTAGEPVGTGRCGRNKSRQARYNPSLRQAGDGVSFRGVWGLPIGTGGMGQFATDCHGLAHALRGHRLCTRRWHKQHVTRDGKGHRSEHGQAG